jgi:hypothetical protein
VVFEGAAVISYFEFQAGTKAAYEPKRSDLIEYQEPASIEVEELVFDTPEQMQEYLRAQK